MRRPIVLMLLALAGGILLRSLLPGSLPLWGIACVLLLFSLVCLSHHPSLTVRSNRLLPWISWFLVILLLSGFYDEFRENTASLLIYRPGELCTLQGTVKRSVSTNETYHLLEVQVFSAVIEQQTIPLKERVLVQWTGPLSEEGDSWIGKRVRVTGELKLPDPARNPGLFDYRQYLSTKGIRMILAARGEEALTVTAAKIDWLPHLLDEIKTRYLKRLSQTMDPDSVALMAGMLFGDTSLLSKELYEAFQKNGTAHILSVSGIHISLIYGYLEVLTGRRKGLFSNGVTVMILMLYAALSGFSVSVVRSVFMILVYIASKTLHRRYDMTSATAFTAVVLLLYQPCYLFNIGFQLSYLAVFTLSTVFPWLQRKIRQWEGGEKKPLRSFLLRTLLPTAVIQAGMAPITATVFSYFSLSGFLLNVPVIALSGVVIPLGLVLFLFTLVPGPLFSFCSIPPELLSRLIVFLNQAAYQSGVAFLSVPSPAWGVVLLFYVLTFAFTSELGRKQFHTGNKKLLTSLAAGILLLTLLSASFLDRDLRQADLVFLDVGQGDALHIKTPEGRNILLDTGGSTFRDVGKTVLLPYLLKNGVTTLDLVLVSHLHSDHYLGLVSLSDHMKIKRLLLHDQNRTDLDQVISDTGLRPDQIGFVVQGDTIQLGKEITLSILYPAGEGVPAGSEDRRDENQRNMVSLLEYRGTRVMMTGDLTGEDEAALLKEYQNNSEAIQADILKISHHGSRFSTTQAFLKQVDPQVAIIQVGKNNFGHPHPTVLESLRQHDIMYYRTDQQGAILVDCDKAEPVISPMIHTQESYAEKTAT